MMSITGTTGSTFTTGCIPIADIPANPASAPNTKPKNTATPPITGTGLVCSFLLSGQSDIFLCLAKFNTRK